MFVPRKYQTSVALHLICPGCLMPMHIRTAEIVNGQEIIRVTCDYCGAEELRDHSVGR